MPDYSIIRQLDKLLAIAMLGLFLAFAITTIQFRSVDADECGEDADWPEKPCPAYGAQSEAELRKRWDNYYEMKGEDWMGAKKAEMHVAIKEGTFTEWIKYAPNDNNFANRNVYFYYRLNNQAPLMVYDPQSGQYFNPEEQEPSNYSYSALSGDYYINPPSPPWYLSPAGLFVIIGIGATAAAATWLIILKKLKYQRLSKGTPV